MQVNSGMMMNGQPQQGYPPQTNQPYSPGAQFVHPGQRPPAPFQQFNQPPSSSGFAPASGNMEDNVLWQFVTHTWYSFVKSKHC